MTTAAFSTAQVCRQTLWCCWVDDATAAVCVPDAWGVAESPERGRALALAWFEATAPGTASRFVKGPATSWRHRCADVERRARAFAARGDGDAIDVPRPGRAVIGVAALPDDRHVWVVWSVAERVAGNAAPDAWGVVDPDPAFALFGKTASMARGEALTAAAAWLDAHAPDTLRGCAMVDALAGWWSGQLMAQRDPAVWSGLRPAPGAAPPFAGVLGLAWPCDRAAVVRAFRRRVLVVHPDRGGDASEFMAVRAAYEQALQAMG